MNTNRVGVAVVLAVLLLAFGAWAAEAIGVPDIVRLDVNNVTFAFPGDGAAPSLQVTINGALFWDNRTGAPAVGSVYFDQYTVRAGTPSGSGSGAAFTAVWEGGVESGPVAGTGGLVSVLPTGIGNGGGTFTPLAPFGTRPDAFVIGFSHPHQPYGVVADLVFPILARPDYDPSNDCCLWPPAFLVPGDAPVDADHMETFMSDGSGHTVIGSVVARPTGGTQSITAPEPAPLILLGIGLAGVALGSWARP